MTRPLALGLVLLATAASSADLTLATRHTAPSRVAPGQKTQWAPSGNFSALHARAVFRAEFRSEARPYARARGEVAAGFGIFLSRDSTGAASYLSTPNGLGPWSYANLSPARYTDPDGRVIVDEGTGEVTMEENDTSEDLMLSIALYPQHLSEDRRAQLGRILEANEFASARGELSAEEFEKQNRAALFSALHLGLQDARNAQLGERQDQGVLEASTRPRGKRVVSRMREISKKGYDATEFAAGVLGAPTSKEDVALMAIPVAGGVIRVTKTGLKKVFGLLMRNSADDAGKVLSRLAGTKGFEGVEFIARGPHLNRDAIASAARFAVNPEVPSVAGGGFANWFNRLSSDEFDRLWSNPVVREQIEARLRHPGGLHEWHLVSRASTFKRWGVTAEEIERLRTATGSVRFKNPSGFHGGTNSTTAHNEMLDLIDEAGSYVDFVARLRTWADKRLVGGAKGLPGALAP